MEEKILTILMELKEGQNELKSRFDTLEKNVDKIAIDLESVKEQTADLLKFKTETASKLDKISDTVDFSTMKIQQSEKEMFLIKRKLDNIHIN